MTDTIFHNKDFTINNAYIPEFELKKENLIRIYIPNFNTENLPLGFDLTLKLIKRFQNQKIELTWAKNYRQNRISELLNPLTVYKYLVNKMQIKNSSATIIAQEIGVNLTDRFNNLSFTNRKALIIKTLFSKNNSIILDYYGVSANEIKFLEKIVDVEIKKGKSAIAFDRLEYLVEEEPYKNITPIKIKLLDPRY